MMTKCRSTVRSKGFTIVELMIVVAVVGILVAISLSAYGGYAVKSRRADAREALTTAQSLLERCYAQNNQYPTAISAGALTGCPGITFPTNSSQGYYTLALSNMSATSYLITATVAGAQTTDLDCNTMSIDNTGAKTSTASAGAKNPGVCGWP